MIFDAKIYSDADKSNPKLVRHMLEKFKLQASEKLEKINTVALRNNLFASSQPPMLFFRKSPISRNQNRLKSEKSGKLMN